LKNRKVQVILLLFLLIVAYGFYEKERRAQLYVDFRANKPLQCGDVVVQKSKGWRIGGNKVFTDGKQAKTVIFCERIE
jgi:hypothetical protein